MTHCNINDLIRQDETLKDKYLAYTTPSKASIINAIVEHPILLQRPIIMFKAKGVAAITRTEEALISLLRDVNADITIT
jgi:arsenate reductase-like glutaredoxin family protein